MRVLSRRRLREYWVTHADAEGALRTWFAIARRARWRNLSDVRGTYAAADGVAGYTIFNIKGNAHRLVTKIEYRLGTIFIKAVLTHAEYDKDTWK